MLWREASLFAVIITRNKSPDVTGDGIYSNHYAGFKIFTLWPTGTWSEMKISNLKVEDMIMCQLVRCFAQRQISMELWRNGQ